MIKKLLTTAALALLALNLQAHKVCIDSVQLTVTKGLGTLMQNPLFCAEEVIPNHLWMGTCILDDGTNCASAYGTVLFVWLPYVATTNTVVGSIGVGCTNGKGASAVFSVEAGQQGEFFRFLGDCDANNCSVAVCPTPYSEPPHPPPDGQ